MNARGFAKILAQLPLEQAAALIDPKHRPAIQGMLDQLVRREFPTHMILGERSYKTLPCPKPGESLSTDDPTWGIVQVGRSGEDNDDYHVIYYQAAIPPVLRGQVRFITLPGILGYKLSDYMEYSGWVQTLEWQVVRQEWRRSRLETIQYWMSQPETRFLVRV